MIVRTFGPLAAIALLAGCNSDPDVDLRDAEPKEVADAMAAAGADDQFVSPGKWQQKTTLEAMEVPGMPAEVARQMQATMNRTETTETCLTPEEVRKPKEDFFAGDAKNCTYDRFTMSGGKIDAAMTCQDGGASTTVAMTGTYSADAYQARMAMTASGAGQEGGMKMQMSVDAKRIGECSEG